MSNKETISLILLILTTIIVAFFAGYANGYKNGQIDALNGKYHYEYKTNVVIELINNK